jgi:superfamily II DNA or RNA helicase
MFNYETDDFFVNIHLKQEVADELLDFQYMHVFNLITALRSNNVILDGSDMGTGKTFCAIAICKQLNLRPFVVCPKSVISCWKNVCQKFNVRELGIVNYESIKNGKYYENNKHVDCPFIEVIKKDDKVVNFKWKIPRYGIIIFDEVHNCKNPKTQNGKLLLSSRMDKFQKVIMLSATLSDKPEWFSVFGYMLGFYNNMKQANNWINGMILDDKTYIGCKPKMSAINQAVYPNKGSRMRISELGNKFPSNQILAEGYYIDPEKRKIVNQAFETVNELHLKGIEGSDKLVLTEIIKARKLIEELKIPIIEELAKDYVENGYSVVIFVNFIMTIKKLSKSLNTDCIIDGFNTDERRLQNIKLFQENSKKILICNMGVAEGLNLHDEHGVPRVSLISPSFSTTQLIQALGRICRAGSKTPALQRIIYCADTCEEVICKRIKNNLQFLAKLNDNDLIQIK